MTPKVNKGAVVLKSSYRSRLEERVAAQLTKAGVTFGYETMKVGYTVPARKARYTPDFPTNGGIVLEAKGRFRTAAERQKLLLVKEQHPELDLRLVFQKASNPIYKGSPTTYAMWADTHGIPWADNGVVPDNWIKQMKSAT